MLLHGNLVSTVCASWQLGLQQQHMGEEKAAYTSKGRGEQIFISEQYSCKIQVYNWVGSTYEWSLPQFANHALVVGSVQLEVKRSSQEGDISTAISLCRQQFPSTDTESIDVTIGPVKLDIKRSKQRYIYPSHQAMPNWLTKRPERIWGQNGNDKWFFKTSEELALFSKQTMATTRVWPCCLRWACSRFVSPWQQMLFYFRISELISDILGGGKAPSSNKNSWPKAAMMAFPNTLEWWLRTNHFVPRDPGSCAESKRSHSPRTTSIWFPIYKTRLPGDVHKNLTHTCVKASFPVWW